MAKKQTRAEKIRFEIEDKIGFSEPGLINERTSAFWDLMNYTSPVNTLSSATFGLLDVALGNEKRAKQIRNKIVDKFRFNYKSNLIRSGEDYIHNKLTTENATFGLLERSLGNKEKAIKIRDAIVDEIGLRFNKCLVKSGKPKDLTVYTDANSFFGLLEYSLGNDSRAKEIRDKMEQKIGFIGDLIRFRNRLERPMRKQLMTLPNASFGLLNYALGDKERAIKIRDAIVDEIGFYKKEDRANDLIKYGFENRRVEDTSANATFALLDYVLCDKKGLNKITKRR